MGAYGLKVKPVVVALFTFQFPVKLKNYSIFLPLSLVARVANATTVIELNGIRMAAITGER